MSLGILWKLILIGLVFDHCESSSNVTRRLVRQSDVSYASPAYKYCECGHKNDISIGDIRMVGGMEIAENEYPWMTLIITIDEQFICGGSLINDRYVVTAAHCLALGRDQREMKVVVGEFDLCSADTQTVRFSIDKLIVHPRYDKNINYADIMLVRLNMKVTFNDYVRPICLPEYESRMSGTKKYIGKLATALGWGYVDTNQRVCTLRSVNLEIFRPEYCGINIATIICAGFNDNGRDVACKGDSGDPLQMMNSHQRYELIGLRSMGNGCGNGYFGLHTDVVAMIPWIMEITTQDSMYCWR